MRAVNHLFPVIGNRNTAAERGIASVYTAHSLNQHTNILCASAFHFRVQSGRYQALIRSGLFVDCMLTIVRDATIGSDNPGF